MNSLFFFTIFAVINLNPVVIAFTHCQTDTAVSKWPQLLDGFEVDVEVLSQNTGLIPETRKPSVISNVGKTKVSIRFQYYFLGWKTLAGRTLSPGESWTYDYEGKSYQGTRALASNLEGCVGAVSGNANIKQIKSLSTLACSAVDQYCFSWFLGGIPSPSSPRLEELDWKKVKTVTTKALDQIPTVGQLTSLLVDIFWELKDEEAWQQVKNKVKDTIRLTSNEDKLTHAAGILNKLILQIESVKNSTDSGTDVKSVYMDTLRQVSFVHAEFAPYVRKSFGYFLLPYLSSMLISEAAFCKLGLSNSNMFTRSQDEVKEIEIKLSSIVNQGVEMIQDINKHIVKNINDPTLKQYNYYAQLHNHLATNGADTIHLLQKFLLEKPKPFYGLIRYSDIFGQTDVQTMWQGFRMDEPPLTPPHLSDGKWNKLTKLSLCKAWTVSSRLGGLKLEFQDGSSYNLGDSRSQCSVVAHLGMDKFIERVEVCGGHMVDSMKIFLSDKTSYSMGACDGAERQSKTFAEPDHYVASFFVANGYATLPNQISSIGVSFLPKKYL